MDSVAHPSTTTYPQTNNLNLGHVASSDNIGSALPNDLLSSQVDQQDHRLIKENLAIVEASSKNARCGCYCTRTDEDEVRRIKSKKVDLAESQKPLRPQLCVTPCSSGIGDRCSDYESSLCSDDGPTKWDESLIFNAVTVDGWSSGNESDTPQETKKIAAIAYQHEILVENHELANSSEPAKSENTNLEDREYDAALQKSTISSVEESDNEDLPLQDRFFEGLVTAHNEKKGFFPGKQLSILVTEDCVLNELKKCLKDTHSSRSLQGYTRTICGTTPVRSEEIDSKPPNVLMFKKIFAILVLIEKVPSIVKFLEEGLSDLDLPLQKIYKKGVRSSRFELRLANDQAKKLECFDGWSQFSINSFEEWQWTTVAHFFHKAGYKDVKHDSLSDSMMLPFITDGRRGNDIHDQMEFEGGYGSVYRVNIHPDHHNFDIFKLQGQAFAIKRLVSRSWDAFKQEVDMLNMFSNDTHPHLISLLATYEQFGVYSLVFPWADGDLNKYWQMYKPKPCFDIDTVTWFAQQCQGIADGLVKIHSYQTSHKNSLNPFHEKRYGRHGDLKPENILWFADSNGGTLKISDFGLSEYSTVHNKSYKARSRVATSMSYRAPECDLKGGKIGQSYDIWTLGCLYLEFVTWLLGGWELIKVFEGKRMAWDSMWYNMNTDTFFELVECPNANKSQGQSIYTAQVKPSVVEFIQQLHGHESCTEFLHDFINMIHFEMLLVKPNDPNDKGRVESTQVLAMIKRMRKGFDDPCYASTPAGWCPRH